MILCFYRQELETFKENHKIIDVPFSSWLLLKMTKTLNLWSFDWILVLVLVLGKQKCCFLLEILMIEKAEIIPFLHNSILKNGCF